jgi:hypothetical protein
MIDGKGERRLFELKRGKIVAKISVRRSRVYFIKRNMGGS